MSPPPEREAGDVELPDTAAALAALTPAERKCFDRENLAPMVFRVHLARSPPAGLSADSATDFQPSRFDF